MPLRSYSHALEDLYRRYNHPRYVHPDPLEFLADYPDPADRETVALIASSLAYGRVAQILKSVRRVLDILGPRPAEALDATPPARLARGLAGFKHRFATGRHVAALLAGIRDARRQFGSLEACLVAGMHPGDQTVLPALSAFAGRISAASGDRCGHLLPDPARGGACKRLHLLLRWMVRHDRVDPGGWDHLSPGMLIVPVDVHMHRLALALGATRRRTADARTALEITAAFRTVCPRDPARYDFALTRLGIRPDADRAGFIQRCLALE